MPFLYYQNGSLEKRMFTYYDLTVDYTFEEFFCMREGSVLVIAH